MQAMFTAVGYVCLTNDELCFPPRMVHLRIEAFIRICGLPQLQIKVGIEIRQTQCYVSIVHFYRI